MSTYIITGYARNLKSRTSSSHTYRPEASHLIVLQNHCLARDTISLLHFLYINKLLQYSTLPSFSYIVFTGLTRLYTLQCSVLSHYQGYHQSPHRTRSNQGLSTSSRRHPTIRDAYSTERGPPTPRRQTIAHLELHQKW
jgi:hypothetical protein